MKLYIIEIKGVKDDIDIKGISVAGIENMTNALECVINGFKKRYGDTAKIIEVSIKALS